MKKFCDDKGFSAAILTDLLIAFDTINHNLLIAKFKENDKGFSAAILMECLKAFDTINHSLLIANLKEYGMRRPSLKLQKNYFSNRFR